MAVAIVDEELADEDGVVVVVVDTLDDGAIEVVAVVHAAFSPPSLEGPAVDDEVGELAVLASSLSHWRFRWRISRICNRSHSQRHAMSAHCRSHCHTWRLYRQCAYERASKIVSSMAIIMIVIMIMIVNVNKYNKVPGRKS